MRAQESVSREMALHPTTSTANGISSSRTKSEYISPSREGGNDPAPVRHEEETVIRGKYEASEPYKSRKGDRFS